MTDKTKPISASNPPESKGIRTGYQPKEQGKPTNPPSGGSNVVAPKPAKKVKTDTELLESEENMKKVKSGKNS